MYLFTIVFTIAVLPGFLTIVNVIVKVFVVFYDVFSKFTISLFTILFFLVWRARFTQVPQAAETLVPQSITLRGSRYSLGARTDV